MYCHHCGTPINSTSQFCARCGKRVEENTTAQQAQPSPVSHKKRRSSPKLLLTGLAFSIPLVLVGFIFFRILSTDDLSEARQILNIAVQDAISIEDISQKAWILARIADAQSMVGDQAGALSTVNLVVSTQLDMRNFSLEVIAITQARAGNKPDAYRTVESIDGDSAKKASLLAQIATACAQANDPLGAAEALKKAFESAAIISDDSQKAFALAAIAEGQANADDVGRATETATHITDEFQRSRALGAIVSLDAKRGRIKEAWKTAIAMPNGYWKALALGDVGLASMKSRGNVTDAEATLQEAVNIAARISETYWKVLALTEVGLRQAQAGEQLRAVATFRQALQFAILLADRFKSYPLSKLAAAQVEAGDMNAATTTFKQIPYTADLNDLGMHLSAFAEAQAKAGDFKGALKTAARIEHVERHAFALAGIAAAQAKLGNVREAREWAMKETTPFSKAYILLGVVVGILERRRPGVTIIW
jgi:tetratricopeptide (TPR) repeat protein